MTFLQKLREFIWEHPWVLIITIPGLAYILYQIRMKIHRTARNRGKEGHDDGMSSDGWVTGE